MVCILFPMLMPLSFRTRGCVKLETNRESEEDSHPKNDVIKLLGAAELVLFYCFLVVLLDN